MVDVAGSRTVLARGDSAVARAGIGPDLSSRNIRTAAVCLLGVTFATSLLPYTALGFAVKPITEQLHWTREQFWLGNSYLMWSGALTVWVMGFITDKVGARWVIIPGAALVGIVTLALAATQHLWQFYLGLALLGMFGSSAASYSKVVVSLFAQNRGKAMAVFGAEGALVRALIPTVAALLIASFGWRGMFEAIAAVILLAVPILFFGLEEPGAAGRLPSLGGRDRPAVTAAPPPRLRFGGRTMGEALGDGAFWMLLAAGLISGVVSNGFLSNVVAAIEDKGFSEGDIAQLMALTALFGVAGTLLAGYLMDRFPTTKIAAPFSLLAAVGYFILMTVTPDSGGKPMLLVGLGLGIFAFSAHLPMAGYFLTRYFGLKSFATISGLQVLIQSVCMGLAPLLAGRVYDVNGNYDVAFEAGIVATLFTAAIFLILPAYRFPADVGPAQGAITRKPAAY